jgi:fumarate hydratase class II
MSQIFRKEVDSLGSIDVDDRYYWGAQTQRSLKFFDIGSEKMPARLIHAFALQKKAATLANLDLGLLDRDLGGAIIWGVDRILANEMNDNFPLSVWQTGSGTQTNMNLNEVIANLANEKLGSKSKGTKSPVHPNDHVNKGQSSNDSFPTAMNISVCLSVYEELLPALRSLEGILRHKSSQWEELIKIGRTHLQDATPMTLGQEFLAFSAQMQYNYTRIKQALNEVYFLAQGGTAVGTGVNTHPLFSQKFILHICNLTNLPFKTASNKFESLSSHDSLMHLSGTLNTLAGSLMKIANDIRLLGSGPRCGFGELRLPENEPGSSIMPGKVNPTQCEALTMICAKVIGNHTSISIAAASGHLQLNVFKPLIIDSLLQSIILLSDGMRSFADNCVCGIEPNVSRLNELKDKSLMLVAALNSKIGYDNAAKIAKKAFHENLTLKQAAMELGLISEYDFDKLVRPQDMIHPK